MSQKGLTRYGGAVLMLGALVGIVGLAVRPAPLGLETTADVLNHYQANLNAHRAHAIWTPIGWILVLVGLGSLFAGIPEREGVQWSDLALITTPVFVVLGIVDSTMDGILLPLVGEYYQLTGGADAATALGESLYFLMEALAGRFALMYALSVLFTGLALHETSSHPDWLGWAGAVLGVTGAIFSVVWVTITLPPVPPESPIGFLFFAFVLTFPWLLLVGWYMLRPTRPASES